MPAGLAGQKFPPLFTVESEYHLAMVRAELAFVNDLVRRIVEEGWGPVEVWRSVQAACAPARDARRPQVRQQEESVMSTTRCATRRSIPMRRWR